MWGAQVLADFEWVDECRAVGWYAGGTAGLFALAAALLYRRRMTARALWLGRLCGWGSLALGAGGFFKLCWWSWGGWPASLDELGLVLLVLGYYYSPGIVLGAVAVLLCRTSQGVAKRSTPPKCSKCGYILKGLTAPRCPECGLPFDMNLLQCD